MGANYVLIQEVTLNASASSVTFSNIPQTGYTDLKLVSSTRDTRSGSVLNGLVIRFNGSSTGFTSRVLEGSGSAASSFVDTQGLTGENTSDSATANTFSSTETYIPNYTSSNAKSFSFDSVTENNATAAYSDLGAGLWNNTSAITSITLTSLNSASFVAGSSFSLYGIAAVGTTPTVAPKASGGDIVVNDGTYWYHAFLSSGTFTPNTNISADALVVAGGGGGYFGGGGAGGFLSLTSQSLTATPYSCIVGAGGVGGKVSTQSSTQGSNSQIGSLTAAVGGGYGGPNGNAGGTGGSGGGSANATNASGTAGQGNAGGSGSWGGYYVGGGGGGAGAVGTNSSGATAGAGGAGSNSFSSWASVTNTGASGYYAGGGGGASSNSSGAAGGSGGGGAAGNSPSAGNAGTVNTGGGGGGTDGNFGGAGGSGIVIIRYAMA